MNGAGKPKGQSNRPDISRNRSGRGNPFPKGTILLHAEQGLGDTIQFIRFAALVKQRVGTVLCECPTRL